MEYPDQNKSIQIRGRLLRIARLDAEFFLYLSDPPSFIDALRKDGRRIDLFTFQQAPADPAPRYPYFVEWEDMAILPVSTYDYWATQQIPSTTRRHVKKVAKFGITLRETPCDEALVRGVWKIYNETPMRQGRAFSHYGDTIEKVRRDLSTYLDSSIFVGAYRGEELIGFIKLVADEARTQLCVMHILSLISERDKAPTNALLSEAVRVCADRGIPFLSYLLMNYSNKKGDGLSNFKVNNGFESHRVPRYYVPLTLWGRVALALGCHHRILDRIPAGVADSLRSIRSRFMQKRLHAN